MSFRVYPAYKIVPTIPDGSIPSAWEFISLRRFAQLIYGDALPTDTRNESGNTSVFGSNGPVGRHDDANTLGPVVIVGRKGSHGALQWSQDPVYVIDTAFFADARHITCDLRWFYWLLQTLDLPSLSQDTGVPGLSRDAAYDLKCPFPSLIEQTGISAFLDRETAKVNGVIDEQERLIRLLLEKRQAVIHQAVSKGIDASATLKNSEVEWLGEVPATWSVSRLGYYASVKNGSTPDRTNASFWLNGTLPWISSGEVNQYWVTEVSEYITQEALDQSGLHVISAGAVLVGLVGQGKTRGMSAFLRIPAAINQNVAAVTVWPGLSASFLHYTLQAAYEFLRECGRGGNQAALNCEILADFRIAVPPPSDQVRICAHLDAVHASTLELVRECETAIRLLRERRAALISAAITGKIDVRDQVAEDRLMQQAAE